MDRCYHTGAFDKFLICDLGHEPSTSQKGNHVNIAAEKTGDRGVVDRKPLPLTTISEFMAKSPLITEYSGRNPYRGNFQLDHGHIIKRADNTEAQRRRRFQC